MGQSQLVDLELDKLQMDRMELLLEMEVDLVKLSLA